MRRTAQLLRLLLSILVITACAPQKVDPTSRCNFFEPVFMVQPAKNISRSYPAFGRQFMPMDAWARPRSTARIHVIQAFTADRSHQPFTVSIGLRRLHGCS